MTRTPLLTWPAIAEVVGRTSFLHGKAIPFNKELVITKSAAEKVGGLLLPTVGYSCVFYSKSSPLGRIPVCLLTYLFSSCLAVAGFLCYVSTANSTLVAPPLQLPPIPPTSSPPSSASTAASPSSRITFRIISQKPTLVPTIPALWF